MTTRREGRGRGIPWWVVGPGLAGYLFMAGLAPAATAAVCDAPPTCLVPLTDLSTDLYQGEQGGSTRTDPTRSPPPTWSWACGQQPRSSRGTGTATPDPSGSIVVISIGVSNTVAEFGAFVDLVAGQPAVSPNVVLVNGAQVGRALGQWSPGRSDTTWETVDRNLASAGVTPLQVQAAWVMLPSNTRGPATLGDAQAELEGLATVMEIARERYSNLAVIEDHIEGSPRVVADPAAGEPLVPWLALGPYLWADGSTPRETGWCGTAPTSSPTGPPVGSGAKPSGGDVMGPLLHRPDVDRLDPER